MRESRQRLAYAMNLAQLFDWIYDVERGLFVFSDRYYALHGTTSELEGGNLLSAETFANKFVHPDDAHMISEEIAKAVATPMADATMPIRSITGCHWEASKRTPSPLRATETPLRGVSPS